MTTTVIQRFTIACIVIGTSSCVDRVLVEPARMTAVQLSPSVVHLADTVSAPGWDAAYDSVDGVWIELSRGGEAFLAETVAFAADSGGASVTLEVELEADEEEIAVAFELRQGSEPLFHGAAAVTVRAGEESQANVALEPVAAEVGIASPPASNAVGDTIDLLGAAMFATQDTVSTALEWSILDAGVVEMLDAGRVLAIAAGTARVRGAYGDASQTVTITVGQSFVVGDSVRVIAASGSTQGQHVCALRADGAALCWGDNTFGQLGVGSTEPAFSTEPVAVAGGHAFISLASGVNHVCGLTAAGDAYCWGNNVQGQLGAGAGPHQFAPVPVSGGLRFTSISGDGNTTCGLTTDGAAYCWGNNNDGQLGDGTFEVRYTPVAVTGGHTFASLAASSAHACALTAAGEAWCWGQNDYGELGTGVAGGPNATEPTPQAAAAGQRFAHLTTNSAITCGLTEAGHAWCWGLDPLGDGTVQPSTQPVAVAGGLAFRTLTAAVQAVCGIVADGTGYCWGINRQGRLGTGDIEDRLAPAPVNGGLKLAAIAPGGAATCAISDTGAGYCWGDVQAGFLGNGESNFEPSPVPLNAGLSFRTVAAAGNSTCAVTQTGDLYCWGSNGSGQLGNGTQDSRYIPTQVETALTFDTVAVAVSHTCALDDVGAGYCWGDNTYGQLGDATTAQRLTPTPVMGGHTFRSIHVGAYHTCAVTTADALLCWGYDAYGQLGNGSSGTMITAPDTAASGLQLQTAATGYFHTCGITPSGAAYCWGSNFGGALGNGSGVDEWSPVAVSGGHVFASIQIGPNPMHTCGLTTAGEAYCWGRNPSGQVGNGTTADASTPALVSGGLVFDAIATDVNISCGTGSTGDVHCWGRNQAGRFGTGSFDAGSSAPVPAVAAGQAVTSLAFGNEHGCAVLADGSMSCWGSRERGQIGDGKTRIVHLDPVAVIGGHTFLQP